MIRVSYTLSDSKVVELNVTGHANFAKKGSDIVCSAVSAIVIGGLTNLSSEKNYKISVREGEVSILALNDVNEHDQIVLETIIVQLEKIEESYGKYIQIDKIVR